MKNMRKSKISFIGLGLNDETDISLKGLNEINKCDKVYAEFYTAKLFGTSIKKIETQIKKKIIILGRKEVENGDEIINDANNNHIVFLSCGDSMAATTHLDLRLRAINKGIKIEIIHGSSIFTAVPGLLGLQNYKFGRTTTLAYPENDYFPTSPYDIIKQNHELGMHSLVLLDIQTDKNRYMTANEGIKILEEYEKKIRDGIFNDKIVICVVARAGSKNTVIKADYLKNIKNKDFGPPLHTIVIPGRLHFLEIEALEKIADLPTNISQKLQKL
jgi:diphthine synthase